MTITAEEKYGRYSLCFRVTCAKSGVGYDVKPFSTAAVNEPTTFALCCEFQGDDGEKWMEVNSRTVGCRNHTDGTAMDDGTGKWLGTLWREWLQGRKVERWIAEQFEAIRQDSQRLLFNVYGKKTFTQKESEIAAEEWHESLKLAEFWNRIIPPKPLPPSGLTGSFGVGGGI